MPRKFCALRAGCVIHGIGVSTTKNSPNGRFKPKSDNPLCLTPQSIEGGLPYKQPRLSSPDANVDESNGLSEDPGRHRFLLTISLMTVDCDIGAIVNRVPSGILRNLAELDANFFSLSY
jgi:hypothetical protein